MHPIHDADVLLLLALAFASKRKPASVEDATIALGTLQPRLPAATKLLDAFDHLSRHGLILASDEGYALSIEGQKLMQGVAIKGELEMRVAQLRERLAASNVTARHAGFRPDADALAAAIAAWQAALPPPTKSEKIAEQREARLREENARRIAEGKPPRPPKVPGPKRTFGAKGPSRGAGRGPGRGPDRGSR